MDLSKNENQIEVAKNWGQHKESIILTDNIKALIDDVEKQYELGNITNNEMYNQILDLIHEHFKN